MDVKRTTKNEERRTVSGRLLLSPVRRLSSVVCRPSSASGRNLTSLLRQGFSGHADLWPSVSAKTLRRDTLTSGFSLVEVTLALMVMAIGILSIMSLFPAGLDQNARSIADTHAAFFAEEVFAGLQARAETNWAGLEEFSVRVAARGMWDAMDNLRATNALGLATNIYKYPLSPHYEDHALRYRLVVTNIGANSLLKAATLWVWPGEFGSTNDPAMFYAEFFRWKP